jgi:hypothetical protein
MTHAITAVLTSSKFAKSLADPVDLLTDYDYIVSPILGVTIAVIAYFVVRNYRRKSQLRNAEAIAAGLPPPATDRPLPWIRGFISAATLAAIYLVAFRLITLLPPYHSIGKGAPILMSFSFLFLGPFIAGALTVYQSPTAEPWPQKAQLLAPWIPIFFNALLALSVKWEGMICIVFILPPAMLFSSLGGIAVGYFQRHRQAPRGVMYSLATLPLLLAMVEAKLQQPLETRTVNTEILIHAPVSVIWQNIGRVRPIARSELRPSWANLIGFPRPVEATMSYDGVGAVRHGSFERGLSFDETVTAWEPNYRYAFTIRANTTAIPATTLDEHVTVGGRFFDLLDGEYILEPLSNGDVILHLDSRQRLSTDFNLYAAMWSDAVMHDVQNNILYVVRNRCEADSNAAKLLN